MWVVTISGNVIGLYDTYDEVIFAASVNFESLTWKITST